MFAQLIFKIIVKNSYKEKDYLRKMLLDFIARYYKFLWLALGAVAFLKIILSTIFTEILKE